MNMLTFSVYSRLQGLISYEGNVGRSTGHFIAYCKRSQWEIHNDLCSKIDTVKETKQIMPNAAIYIREE